MGVLYEAEEDINDVGNFVIDTYGAPPFGTLVSCNASPSSLINFGQFEDNKWITFHQTGNWREHEYYWYLTEIYHNKTPMPAINGEQYYSGFQSIAALRNTFLPKKAFHPAILFDA